MALSLEDIMKIPDDPTLDHLTSLGIVKPQPPVAPIVPAATLANKMTPATALEPVSSMKPMTPAQPGHFTTDELLAKEYQPDSGLGKSLRGENKFLNAQNVGHAAPIAAMTPAVAPDITASVPEVSAFGPPAPGAPTLGYKEQMSLPKISDAVHPGTSQFYQNELERQEAAKAHPWGTEENHPGVLGKIGHVLGRIGNTALDVFAPATAALIPGTELNERVKEAQTKRDLAGAEERELAGKVEETREKHEENVSQLNQDKLDQADKKLEEEQHKHLSDREIALRKQGLKPNPADPNGTPVPIAYEDMSPTEQAVHDLKVAQADSQTAKAALDKIKADPNSPQSKAALDRVRIMAQNAATAAGKLGLDKEKFIADYFGLDKDGNPLPGTGRDESGKPVGPRVQNAGKQSLAELNKNYVKPANDVEKSYQMMDKAYKEYKDAAAEGKQLPTGAQSMLALSTHLATTFGNVKGSRVTKDMIEHHLGARSVSDAALVAFQKLTNGDVLSPDQWEAFHDLIGQSRKLSWQTAAKEAKRAKQPVDFLPADLQGELGGKTSPNNQERPSTPPREAAPGMKWQQNKRTGEFREVPATS